MTAGPATRLLYGDVQVLDVLGARMPDLDEGLVGELRLEGEHEPLCGLAGRVRDDVELDGDAVGVVRAHRPEASARRDRMLPMPTDEGETMAFAELKARQSVMWGNGPYERITNTLRDIHELVIERADPKPGEQVLDAATGTGAVAILAAKRGADVVGQDLAPVLIETARERAAEDGVEAQFEVGDAEAMTYEDASFDVVTSTCGVMFAPDHPAVAAELARVIKPGGRLALACWTPEGGLGQMFRMMGPFLPPPAPGAGSPFTWGTEEHVRELLG